VDLLNKELFAGVTVLHLLLALIGLMLLLWLIDKIRGPRDDDDEINVAVRCGCGWSGEVSKYARRCPKCGMAIP